MPSSSRFILLVLLTSFKCSYSQLNDYPLSNLTAIDGTNTVIKCKIPDAFTSETLWQRTSHSNDSSFALNLQESLGKYQLVDNGDLLISSVKTEKDEGVYTCSRNTTSGVVNASTVLEVLTKTKIVDAPSDAKVILSSTAKFRCGIEKDSRVTIAVHWSFNGRGIQKEASNRVKFLPDYSLVVEQARNTDVGLYTCTVKSMAGDDKRSARLDVIELPYPPANVKAELNVNGGLVNVSWSPPFDGNSPIVKYIVYKRVLTSADSVDESAHDISHGWSVAVGNISASQNFVLVTNLRPAMTYQFRVSAVNFVGEGQSGGPSHPPVTLPAQPPSAPPFGVVGAARSSMAITVQWQPPPPDAHNGQLMGYIVRYKLAGYSETPWYYINITNVAQLSVILDDLIVWQNYEIQVGAYNTMGVGSYSPSIYVRTKEGIPAAAPRHVWVKSINSTTIQVSWNSPDPQLINGINQGYKLRAYLNDLLYKEIIIDPHPLPDIVHKFNMTGLEPFTTYKITVVCFTSAGDGPENNPAMEITTEQYRPSEVSDFKFWNILDTSLEVGWSPPKRVNGELLCYTLQYFIVGSSEDQWHVKNYSASTNSARIDGLKPQTAYTFEIFAWTAVGAGPTKMATIKSSIPPVLPGPPSRLAISNIGAFSVVLQFTPGFNGNATIKTWIVEGQLFKLRNASWFTIYESHDEKHIDAIFVKNLRPYTEYRLRLIPVNIVGRSLVPSEPSPPFQTLQAPPAHPPLNVTIRSLNPTSLRVRWTPLPPESWYGQPRGYNVTWRELASSPDERNGSLKWHIASDYHSHSHSINNLEEYTDYAIQVFALNDVGSSNGSRPVFHRTAESTPSAGPADVFVKSTSSTTVLVNWTDLPPKHHNGILLGYKVKYISNRNDGIVHYKVVEGNATKTATLTELKKYTNYRISVCAFTHVGDGVYSPSLTVQTEQDVAGAPSNVTFPDVSQTTARILWDVPEEPNGEIIAYKVTHKKKDTNDQHSYNSGVSHELPSTDRTYKVYDLSPETYYEFTVTAKTREGWGKPAVVLVYTTNSRELPDPPSRPIINEAKIGSRQVTMSWTPGRDGFAPLRFYSIQACNNGGAFFMLVNKIDPGVTAYTVTGLKPYTSYQFRLRATNDIGDSGWSVESNVVNTHSAPPDSSPNIVNISPYSPTAIAVKWVPIQEWFGDERSAGYKIEYCLVSQPGNCASVTVSGKDASQISIENLEKDQHYEIRVLPYNSQGDGPSSKSKIVYVGEAVPSGEPLDVSAFAMSSQEANVSWSPPANDKQNGQILGYKIFYWIAENQSNVNENLVSGNTLREQNKEIMEIVPDTRRTCILLDLDKWTVYMIQVSAFNPAGDGPRSRPILLHTKEDIPTQVGALKFTNVTMTSLKVSWDPPAKPNGLLTGYYITYETLIGDFSKQVKQKINENSLFVTGLREMVTYTFKVRAETSVGVGPERVGNITTGPQPGSPPAPLMFSVTQSLTSVTLKWKNPDYHAILGYLIEAKQVSAADSEWQPKETLRNGPQERHDLSFTHLAPSARYSFRIMTINENGVSVPVSSDVSSVITAPSQLELRARLPFYFENWFVTSVACLMIVFTILFIASLCVYNTNYKYKQEVKKVRSHDALSEVEFGLDENMENPYASGFELRHNSISSNYRRSHGALNVGMPMAATKSPPRPCLGSITYTDDEDEDDETKEANLYGSSGDSVTEKPSEFSSSGPDSESDRDEDLAAANHFVNHYANVNDTLRKGHSWKKHAHPYIVKPPDSRLTNHSTSNARGAAPPSYNMAVAVTASDDSELDCLSVNLNGGRIIVNNAVGSRAGVIPGFSSFV